MSRILVLYTVCCVLARRRVLACLITSRHAAHRQCLPSLSLLGTRPPGGPHVASSTNLIPITPIRRFPFRLSFPRMKNNANRGRIFGKNDYPHLLAPSPTLAWLVYTYPDYQGNIKESKLGYRKPLSTPDNNHRIGLFSGFLIFSRTPGRSSDRTSTVTSSIKSYSNLAGSRSDGFRTPRESRGVGRTPIL